MYGTLEDLQLIDSLLYITQNRAGIQMDESQMEMLLGLRMVESTANPATHSSSKEEVYISFQQLISILTGGK